MWLFLTPIINLLFLTKIFFFFFFWTNILMEWIMLNRSTCLSKCLFPPYCLNTHTLHNSLWYCSSLPGSIKTLTAATKDRIECSKRSFYHAAWDRARDWEGERVIRREPMQTVIVFFLNLPDLYFLSPFAATLMLSQLWFILLAEWNIISCDLWMYSCRRKFKYSYFPLAESVRRLMSKSKAN